VFTRREKSTDHRSLIIVTFERASPESTCPTIEVVFQVQWPDDFTLMTTDTPVLFRLSVTRQDTRELISLTREEEDMVYTEATNEAAKLSRAGG